jgi:unspecific monooxygenase
VLTANTLPQAVLPVDDPAFIADPYPWLAERRREAPAFRDPTHGVIFFTGYEEISSLLRDRRLGRARPGSVPKEIETAATPELHSAWAAYNRFNESRFFEMEPPEHTRIRRLVSAAFTPQRVRALRPRIEALVDELLAPYLREEPASRRMEFVSAFAEPLPVAVIAELLGVPAGERGRLRYWSSEIVKMYELDRKPDQVIPSARAVEEFTAFLNDLYDRRRRDPQDDLLTALVFAQEDGERLTRQELVSTAIFLLNAGHEATVNALSLGLAALLAALRDHRDVLDGLPGGDTQAWAGAVDELLRYDTPLPLFHRWVYQDLVCGEVELCRDDRVGLLLISGNRDRLRFPEPDRLDFHRPENPHLTFSLGVHYCLGAPLARLEMQAAFAALNRHLPGMRLAAEPRFKRGFVIRGLDELLITRGD